MHMYTGCKKSPALSLNCVRRRGFEDDFNSSRRERLDELRFIYSDILKAFVPRYSEFSRKILQDLDIYREFCLSA